MICIKYDVLMLTIHDTDTTSTALIN